MLLLALPAAASDFTLGVFGNSNEDDTINMQDVTYTELIILEYRDETEFADAKHDGKINMQDVTQIELVILGKEKELTIIDSCDRIVTVPMPVERIIPLAAIYIGPLRTLDVADRIVGVTDHITNSPKAYIGELCELPNVGSGTTADYEVVLGLKPDLILIGVGSYYDTVVDTLESADPNLPILRMGLWGCSHSGGLDEGINELRELGYVVDSNDEAEEYIDWYCGIIDNIKAQTEELSDDEKPRVLFGDFSGDTVWATYGKNSAENDRLEIAGGRNMAADLDFSKPWGYVDLEWVIEQNPDIIVRFYSPLAGAMGGIWGAYGIDDTTEIIAKRDEVMNRSEFAEVAAVENEKVLMITTLCSGYGSDAITIAYYAKWFHPDLFEDLDPAEVHQEFLNRFQHIDYDVTEHGVFVYPPPEEV